MATHKKGAAVAIGVAVVLAILVEGTALYYHNGSMAGICGQGNGCTPSQFIYAKFLACDVQNGSCRIVISNNQTVGAEAVGCEFQSFQIVAVNGVNQSVTTIDLGAGVLSSGPGGPAMSITIPSNTLVPVYCTPTTQSASPRQGGPAGGEVLFANQSLYVQFGGTWH